MHAEAGKAVAARKRGGAKWLDILLDKLPAMPLAQLREVWRASENSEPPALPETLLRSLLAHRLQEHCFGGLSSSAARELRKAAAQGEPSPAAALGPGTRLIREWNGRTIAVQVREDGFVWEERLYSSLSRIACEVTGAKWSGPRFFGIDRNG